MSMIRRDALLAGMRPASTAILSRAESANWYVQALVSVELDGLSQRRRFRSSQPFSARFVGERPDRKQGPEDNSHRNLSIAVCADRNVA